MQGGRGGPQSYVCTSHDASLPSSTMPMCALLTAHCVECLYHCFSVSFSCDAAGRHAQRSHHHLACRCVNHDVCAVRAVCVTCFERCAFGNGACDTRGVTTPHHLSHSAQRHFARRPQAQRSAAGTAAALRLALRAAAPPRVRCRSRFTYEVCSLSLLTRRFTARARVFAHHNLHVSRALRPPLRRTASPSFASCSRGLPLASRLSNG